MPNWKKIVLSGSSANLNNLTVDNAITASSLSVTGDITANRLTTNIVTQSILFTSGSNKFGDDQSDVHEFTGSVNITGSVTGTSFAGDGSALTNVSATVAEVATVIDTFTNVTSSQVTHDFDTKNVIVSVYNNSDQLILPATITTTTNDTVDVTFDSSTTGRVVVAKGGHIVSGSANNGFPYTGSAEITGSLVVTGSVDIFGSLKVKSAQIYDDSNFAYFSHVNRSTPSNYSFMSNQQGSTFINASGSGQTVQILERNGSVAAFNLATASFSSNHFRVSADTSSFEGIITASSFHGDGSGLTGLTAIGNGVNNTNFNSTASFNQDIIQYAAGTIVLKSALDFNGANDDNRGPSTRVSLYHNDEFAGATESLRLDGITGGAIFTGEVRVPLLPTSSYSAISKQYLESTRFEQTLTGDTSYTVTHNLNEDYPIVQVYDNNKFQVLPASVKVTNANVVNLTFATYANFEGKVIVKK